MTRKTRHGPQTTSKTVKRRRGDEMVQITIVRSSAKIDYQEIFNATEVVVDEDHDAPWKEMDGWEHTATSGRKLEDHCHYVEHEQRGGEPVLGRIAHYNEDDLVRAGSYDYRLIEVSWEQVEEWYGLRRAGEHSQVYRERLAGCRRQALETLKNWYENGWTWYGVRCDYDDYSASLWGIQTMNDSPDDPYLTEVRHEIADEVADEMEDDDYEIFNRPLDLTKTREYKQMHVRRRTAHRLDFDNEQEYRAWVERR